MEGQIKFRGQLIEGVLKEGFPYSGTSSLYEELRRKQVQGLDDFTIRELKVEQQGYMMQAEYHTSSPPDFAKALESHDRARAIHQYICPLAISITTQKRLQFELWQMNLMHLFLMNDFLVQERRYAWAENFLGKSITKIRELAELSVCESREEQVRVDYKKVLADLEERLEHLKIRIGLDSVEYDSLVPIEEPVENSLELRLKSAQEKGCKEESDKATQEIGKIKANLSSILYPEIIAVAGSFLTRYIPPNTPYEVKNNGVRIINTAKKRIFGFAAELLAISKKNDRTVIDVNEKEVMPSLVGLIHSDEIALQFGRFLFDINRKY